MTGINEFELLEGYDEGVEREYTPEAKNRKHGNPVSNQGGTKGLNSRMRFRDWIEETLFFPS